MEFSVRCKRNQIDDYSGGFTIIPERSLQECATCARGTTKRCKGCLWVAYCSLEHQKQDFPRHSSECSDAAKMFQQYAESRDCALQELNKMKLHGFDEAALTFSVVFANDQSE